MSPILPITIDDVRSAASQLKGKAIRTPLIENPELNEKVGGRVLFKPECLQRTGSFKFRGAYNRLSRLTEAQKATGVVAFSSGNHAQGVASAAKLLGMPATIVMPADAPALKMAKTKAYGATVVTYDRYTECRIEKAENIAAKTGAVVVPSYDDVFIMAGQGTVGLEMAEDCMDMGISPDQALICCGGGGLSSGSFTALKDAFPKLDGYVVEPSNGYDETGRSLDKGEIEQADVTKKSLCDALMTQSPGQMPFAVLKELGIKGLSVSDEEAMQAVAFAARDLKLTVEPGGAVAVAAVLSGKLNLAGKTTLVVISGGNIDPALQAQALLNNIL